MDKRRIKAFWKLKHAKQILGRYKVIMHGERAISEACIGAHYLLSTVAKISAIASSGKKNINFQHETETAITLNALLLTVFLRH